MLSIMRMPASSLWKAGKPVPIWISSTTLRRNLSGLRARLYFTDREGWYICTSMLAWMTM